MTSKEPFDQIVGVRLTPSQHAKLKKLAATLKWSQSEVIRELINNTEPRLTVVAENWRPQLEGSRRE